MAITDLREYIERLRLHLGDTNPDSYRYMDEWLGIALVSAAEALMPRWNYKYLLNTENDVYRNPNHTFLFPEPPVIQRGDVRPVILMGSIIIKEGSLENQSWNFSSWRDAEIAFSNLEASRSKDRSLERDIEELNSILPERIKRLAQPTKGHLPGFKGNPYEYGS
jgi:hypothetical protein